MGQFLGGIKEQNTQPTLGLTDPPGWAGLKCSWIQPPSLDSGLWLTLLVTFLGSTRW